jgi:Glyoxalase/Bleomycin resistance protein/Dioxygenase superfamily
VQLGARLDRLCQISYITRDLDAAMEHARAQLGIESFHVSESEIEVLTYGEVRPLALRAAIFVAGVHQFEYIQPVSGAIEIYTDEVDLDAALINFHHIAIAVAGPHAEWEKLLAEVRASGDQFAYLFPAVPDPAFPVAFAYVDTRHRLGHYTEYLWWEPSLGGTGGFPKL